MFDFLIAGKRRNAQAVLANRVNNKSMLEVQGHSRINTRTSLVIAALAVPREGREWLWDEAFPILTSDISAGGVSVLHHEPLNGTYVIQLAEETSVNFVRFEVQNVQELGYGYWRIGMQAIDLVHPSVKEQRLLAERETAFIEYAAQQRESQAD